MKNVKYLGRRGLALLLVLMMCLGLLNLTAFASEDTEENAPAVEVQTEEPTVEKPSENPAEINSVDDAAVVDGDGTADVPADDGTVVDGDNAADVPADDGAVVDGDDTADVPTDDNTVEDGDDTADVPAAAVTGEKPVTGAVAVPLSMQVGKTMYYKVTFISNGTSVYETLVKEGLTVAERGEPSDYSPGESFSF